MLKLRTFILMAIFCLYVFPSLAQLTSQEATDLVLNQVLSGELDQIDVFMLDETKSGQFTIFLENNETVELPYSSNWVYFVDDRPFANWAHPCRYIFVDEATGAYQIVNEDFFPVDWETAYTTISAMPRPTPVDLPLNPDAVIDGLDPNPNLYAVIINGCDLNRYWNDISAIYCTLLDVYGYTKENIFVHYVYGYSTFGDDLDGPEEPSDDIDYDAYKTTIHHTFQEMSGENTSPEIPELGPEDQLFIFIDDHGYMSGGHSYVNLPGDDLGDFELAEYLVGINCAQIIVVMEPCEIGGFYTELSDYTTYVVSCKNRSIQTASDDESSWAEMWITGGNYDEFVYYWTAAARGYYPDDELPWEESYEVGSFPFTTITGLEDHPGDFDPDINGDGYVQMEEAFFYSNSLDTWSDDGYYYNPYLTGLDPEDPQEFTDISFNEDLLSLCGIAGHVEATQTVESRNYLIGGNLKIDPTVNLTFENGTGLYTGNENAQIKVWSDASMILEDNLTITGIDYNNQLIVYGMLEIGQNVTFTSSGGIWDLNLLNNEMQAVFNNTTFEKCQLISFCSSLNISNSTFNNCQLVHSQLGNVTVTYTTFNRTWLHLINFSTNDLFTATVKNCNFFSDTHIGAAIDLWWYDKFFITNNNINGFYNGIQIINAGNGISGNQNICENEIYNNCITGLYIYNSTASIGGNYIHNNNYGVRLFDNSNIALCGDPIAGTQQIIDNTDYEVYASKQSFPWYFRYNEIIDEDNLGNPLDPLVYHDLSRDIYRDVRYNCWGDNFVAEEDLYPVNGYGYLPIWCPSMPIPDPDEAIYKNAKDLFEAEFYAQAKDSFQLLINQYPESYYSLAAMKDLFALEKFVTNNYNSLMLYYRTNDSIQADSSLAKLGDFMANKCDVKLENWQTAIYWYEDVIQNPESTEDSIFAIIDLGYTYFLMNNSGNKAGYTGKMLEHVPKSMKEFSEKRDYLLSLLPVDKKNHALQNSLETLKAGELSQNIPNPFSNTTTIYYKLFELGSVHIKVFNHLGIEVKAINEAFKEKGLHKVELNANNLPAGIYYYSLLINGKLSDTKKMIVIK